MLQFVESGFRLRCSTEYAHHCDILERGDLSSSDNFWHCSVASGALIPDIMHDIPLELKLMLKVYIHENAQALYTYMYTSIYAYMYIHLGTCSGAEAIYSQGHR